MAPDERGGFRGGGSGSRGRGGSDSQDGRGRGGGHGSYRGRGGGPDPQDSSYSQDGERGRGRGGWRGGSRGRGSAPDGGENGQGGYRGRGRGSGYRGRGRGRGGYARVEDNGLPPSVGTIDQLSKKQRKESLYLKYHQRADSSGRSNRGSKAAFHPLPSRPSYPQGSVLPSSSSSSSRQSLDAATQPSATSSNLLHSSPASESRNIRTHERAPPAQPRSSLSTSSSTIPPPQPPAPPPRASSPPRRARTDSTERPARAPPRPPSPSARANTVATGQPAAAQSSRSGNVLSSSTPPVVPEAPPIPKPVFKPRNHNPRRDLPPAPAPPASQTATGTAPQQDYSTDPSKATKPSWVTASPPRSLAHPQPLAETPDVAPAVAPARAPAVAPLDIKPIPADIKPTPADLNLPPADIKPTPATLEAVLAMKRPPPPQPPVGPQLEGVLAFYIKDTPALCWTDVALAKRNSRKSFQIKISSDLRKEGKRVKQFRWRSDGLAVDWELFSEWKKRQVRETSDSDSEVEVIDNPWPAPAPDVVVLEASPEPDEVEVVKKESQKREEKEKGKRKRHTSPPPVPAPPSSESSHTNGDMSRWAPETPPHQRQRLNSLSTVWDDSAGGWLDNSRPPAPTASSRRMEELSARMDVLVKNMDRWTRVAERNPQLSDTVQRQLERTETSIFQLQAEMDALTELDA